ncbi:MAG: MBOAT family O-acyltransferase [Acutalibacteraceae bacterium]|nr:MBOAT family O-acyltransferase [Acutalibacteraceae bacterium]
MVGKIISVAKKPKLVTGIGVVAVVATLFSYKYLNCCMYLLTRFLDFPKVEFNLLVPIGISYISFSAISFIVDVYRKDAPVVNFLETLNYISFFPKIICGPIVLYKNFIKYGSNCPPSSISEPIATEDNRITLDLFFTGLNRIMIGLAKKVILADSFGLILSKIPNTGIDVITAIGVVILYGLQLYYDFSGYSDIAIGISNTLGYSFGRNFNFPYTATSITDFWRKWHISLGTFFKEYIYIPLGGNRKGKLRTLFNIGVVFITTGVWHGAGLNYLLWGASHGACRIGEKLLDKNKIYNKVPKFIKWAVTMVIVFLGWQLFRLTDMSQIKEFFSILFGFTKYDNINFTWEYYFTAKPIIFSIIGILGSTLLGSNKIRSLYMKLSKNNVIFASIVQVVLLALFVISIMFIVNSSYSPFMYFQY